MKTLTTAILIAVLLNTASAFTTPTVNESSKAKNELYCAIEKIVEYPANGIELAKSGYVTTTFKVNKDGRIDVKNVNGETALKGHVKKQLEGIQIKDTELFEQYYEIKIYFDFKEKF